MTFGGAKLRVRLGGSGASRNWPRRVFRVGRVVSRGLRKLNTPAEHTRRPPKLFWARCEFTALSAIPTEFPLFTHCERVKKLRALFVSPF